MPQKYPQQFRDRAVRMVTDRLEQDDAPSRYVITQEIARKLGIAAESGCSLLTVPLEKLR